MSNPVSVGNVKAAVAEILSTTKGWVSRETIAYSSDNDTSLALGCANLSRYTKLVVTIKNPTASGMLEVQVLPQTGTQTVDGIQVTISGSDYAAYAISARKAGYSNSLIFLVQGIPSI